MEGFGTFVNQTLIPFAIDVIFALIILVVGFGIAKIAVKGIKKTKGYSKADPNMQAFIVNLVGIGIKVFVIVTAIIVIGVPSSSIIAVIGSCGLAIGLALQGGLGNIASGAIIMFCKPFQIGDFIISGGISGVVKDIGIYYTTITTPDNQNITVPNSTLANSTINNLSTESTRRIDFNLSVSYDTDLDLARKVLLATASMNDMILKDPSAQVFVEGHGDSGVKVLLRVWCASENYWTVYFDMWEDVKKAFDKFNIEIPYNHLNVTIEKDGDNDKE